jgi:hypothetical protein
MMMNRMNKNKLRLAYINNVAIGRKNFSASLGYRKGDYFGKKFNSILFRNTDLLMKNVLIKNTLSEINSDCVKLQIRYASTDSQNDHSKTGSETTNPQEERIETINSQEQTPETKDLDKDVAENWEKLQCSTANYFRYMNTMGQILQDTNIESLSTRSDQLAVASENDIYNSEQEIIINERNTINSQSELVAQAEYSLAQRAQISNATLQQHYNNLQGSMKRLKDDRDAAIQVRKKLEESLEQELESDTENNTENEETETGENLETTIEQAENEKNLETITEQDKDSEGKRKLDVSQEEQVEPSKKQKTESQEPKSLIDDFADLSQEPADYTGGDD